MHRGSWLWTFRRALPPFAAHALRSGGSFKTNESYWRARDNFNQPSNDVSWGNGRIMLLVVMKAGGIRHYCREKLSHYLCISAHQAKKGGSVADSRRKWVVYFPVRFVVRDETDIAADGDSSVFPVCLTSATTRHPAVGYRGCRNKAPHPLPLAWVRAQGKEKGWD